MRKILSFTLVFAMLGTGLFTSCSSVDENYASVDRSLSEDPVLAEAVSAVVNLTLIAQENDWIAHQTEIHSLIQQNAGSALSADDQARLESMRGMTLDEYTAQLAGFGYAVQALADRYPNLMEMSSADRRAVLADAVATNPEVAAYMDGLSAEGRACFLQDLCNLVVNLASLIGGPILCDYIAGAIPVIGPLLCNAVIGLAEDILFGVCGILPC